MGQSGMTVVVSLPTKPSHDVRVNIPIGQIFWTRSGPNPIKLLCIGECPSIAPLFSRNGTMQGHLPI